MEILIATTNTHKLEEIEAILAPLGVKAVGLHSITDLHVDEPIEDAETFEGNAKIKAIHYARATGRMCLADDSGLEVDALNGEPGVYSARYAGVGATREDRDGANNKKLLEELSRLNLPTQKRTARFVCAMCFADPTGRIMAETRGVFEGLIADEPRGSNGFGYDPLLYLPDVGKTSAELSPAEKNARSHRGAATRAMAERIAALGTY